MYTKTSIRKIIKENFLNYSSVSREQKDLHIMSKIFEHEKIKTCKKVALYISQADEPNTSKVISTFFEMGKNIYIPLIKDKNLFFGELKKGVKLKKGQYNILEPDIFDIYDGEIDIFLVPGRAFTYDGKRVGRGVGYYDKFFSGEKYKNAYKIGICYDFQIVPDFQEDTWDIKMDEIIF
ncbi:5-formyltetrahydrofolate cyclo-ligase [Candidatus Gracilibacteria bacterium]|nr:5-formyltetrahydrofolate cyclo-ligase [Candidatus Gracilibacteria bacterium]NUJ99344.1 5-formyltetrahydrofolate cyclo-ligase [Candidatus Gracilibacteria bacterium]